MTTPPNTELKSAEEFAKEIAVLISDTTPRCSLNLASRTALIRSIQHNAMLHAAEIAKSRKYNGVDSYGHAYVEGANQAGDDILTRAEQILKGEK